jgi:hypothetical protein
VGAILAVLGLVLFIISVQIERRSQRWGALELAADAA